MRSFVFTALLAGAVLAMPSTGTKYCSKSFQDDVCYTRSHLLFALTDHIP
jgi:hypothetical protein